MISKEEYIENPCGVSSLPFWKTNQMTVPDGMHILHDRDFDKSYLKKYIDTPYFKLKHNLTDLNKPVLPNGYEICFVTISDFVSHINECYKGCCLTVEALNNYRKRKVYSQELWIAVKDCKSNKIIGTGIAEFDSEIGEGVLEWIQVSENHRGKSIGKFIVNELLQRMKDKASFVTVSGQVHNCTNPEALYRMCGFEGNNIWHILTKINNTNR